MADLEVRAALWSTKPFKAPGLDGLHVGFFQRFWLLVGGSVRGIVKEAFQCGEVPGFLNKTLVTLIPKHPSAANLSSFQPISLCNTVYKLITKIVVAWIRPLLSDLISPMQSAFVPRRNGLDNVIIVQEILHTKSLRKGGTDYMAIKIDLEKAYDRLEWSFI